MRQAGRWMTRVMGVLMLVGGLVVFWLMHTQLQDLAGKAQASRRNASMPAARLQHGGGPEPWTSQIKVADSPW